MKRSRLNLALFAVALGLGAVVFVANRKEPAGPPLTPFAADAVTRISLEHPNAPAIKLEKQNGRWQLVAPVIAEADEFEVNAILGLAGREPRLKLEGGALKDMDLAPPQYTVKLNDVAIELGGVEPLEFRRYVKTEGGVWLIEDLPGAAMDKDYADLVSKNLFPPDAEIERIELPKLTLAKADGKWTVTPADPKATADSMQKLADGWKGARAMWNESAGAARAGGERVKVTLKGGVTREFVIVAREPQLKVGRPDLGVNLVLSKALADELLKLP